MVQTCREKWVRMKKLKKKWMQDERKETQEEKWDGHFYIEACSYIQTCLSLTHNCAFTERLRFYTGSFTHSLLSAQTFHTLTLLHTETLHTDASTQWCFYTKMFLYTGSFRHRRFCTEALVLTDALTHRWFKTQTLVQSFWTKMLLPTEAFTHRSFYGQILLHADALHVCTYRRIYTHTDASRNRPYP